MRTQQSTHKTVSKTKQKKELWQTPTLIQIDLSVQTEGGCAVVPEAACGVFS